MNKIVALLLFSLLPFLLFCRAAKFPLPFHKPLKTRGRAFRNRKGKKVTNEQKHQPVAQQKEKKKTNNRTTSFSTTTTTKRIVWLSEKK